MDIHHTMGPLSGVPQDPAAQSASTATRAEEASVPKPGSRFLQGVRNLFSGRGRSSNSAKKVDTKTVAKNLEHQESRFKNIGKKILRHALAWISGGVVMGAIRYITNRIGTSKAFREDKYIKRTEENRNKEMKSTKEHIKYQKAEISKHTKELKKPNTMDWHKKFYREREQHAIAQLKKHEAALSRLKGLKKDTAKFISTEAHNAGKAAFESTYFWLENKYPALAKFFQEKHLRSSDSEHDLSFR